MRRTSAVLSSLNPFPFSERVGKTRRLIAGAPRWLVEKRDLRRMPRHAFPIHIHAVPAIEMDRFVVPMANIASNVDISIAGHATPRLGTHTSINGDEPLIPRRTDSGREFRGHHHRDAAPPHQLFADMRLASGAARERLVAMDHSAPIRNAAIGNEEPLTLPDCSTAFGLNRPQTIDCGTHVMHVIARYCRREPVTIVAAKQVFVLRTVITHHQNHMVSIRLNVENFGSNSRFTTNIEELPGAVPANVNSDLRPMPPACFNQAQTRTHTGEVPTQVLLGRHTTPSNCWLGCRSDAGEGERKRVTLSRAESDARLSKRAPVHGVSFPQEKLPLQGGSVKGLLRNEAELIKILLTTTALWL